jgi:hypothetical protein
MSRARPDLAARNKARATHGMSGTGTYESWAQALQRCCNPNDNDYPKYGGRGITVCERWREFASFLADMGERSEGMTLEREDVNGNYEPGNCRWATKAEQTRNKRDTVRVTINGATRCVMEWCREFGVSHHRVYARIARGWSPERALTEPKK